MNVHRQFQFCKKSKRKENAFYDILFFVDVVRNRHFSAKMITKLSPHFFFHFFLHAKIQKCVHFFFEERNVL